MTQSSPWMFHFQRRPEAKLRLFCFPYAGGSATVFRGWPSKLSDQVELCAVQLPGRQTRIQEQPLTHVEEVLEEVTQDVAVFEEKPFAIFGHSLGAVISFELAWRLLACHQLRPRHVFLSACEAPQFRRTRMALHDLPDRQFERNLKRYKGTPPEIFRNQEIKQLLFPMLRADFEMAYNYQFSPDRKLDCPVTALGGVRDRTRRKHLEGWGEHTTGSFRMQMLPGDHFYLGKYEDDLLRVIESELAAY